MRRGYVYMLASKPYGTLYIGVTNKLAERVYAHRIGKASEFVPTLSKALKSKGVHLIDLPIDYSENKSLGKKKI